jgi:hypothetical protein
VRSLSLADILPPLVSSGHGFARELVNPILAPRHPRELAEKVSGDAHILGASLAFAMYEPRGIYRPTAV